MKNQPSSAITSEEIAQRAHDIWEQSGRPDGEATEHWLRAERELQEERKQAAQVEKATQGSRARKETGRAAHVSRG